MFRADSCRLVPTLGQKNAVSKGTYALVLSCGEQANVSKLKP